jgi:hypothetical protein
MGHMLWTLSGLALDIPDRGFQICPSRPEEE